MKSKWCKEPLKDTESHGWCANRNHTEAHCDCQCHKDRNIHACIRGIKHLLEVLEKQFKD